MKKLIYLAILLFGIQTTNAQMFGSLTLPGLGGATNANAATYSGDGVSVGAIALFSSKINPTVTALSWNTGYSVLGGKYTVGIAQPVIFNDNFSSNFLPVTAFTPIQLSWDLDNLKLQGSYSFMYGQDLPLNGHLFSLKATRYFNENKYSLNGGIIYEYRHKKGTSEKEFGDAFIVEANFSRHFTKGKTLGLLGYYNANISPEYVNSEPIFNDKSSVSGIGIDAGIPLGKHFFMNAKYIQDLTKNEAIKANKAVIALFYKF
ncbi:transporter [Flavicella marina]|uniref:transporter n=1 Tax=Flavicella marina TaxID=1475951 RepID=UPI001264FF94|nr:transporter [Flavicella marina]